LNDTGQEKLNWGSCWASKWWGMCTYFDYSRDGLFGRIVWKFYRQYCNVLSISGGNWRSGWTSR